MPLADAREKAKYIVEYIEGNVPTQEAIIEAILAAEQPADTLRQQLADVTKERDKALARAKELEAAIGVCVPSILRCFIKQTDSDLDRELAAKVLCRVNKAMGCES